MYFSLLFWFLQMYRCECVVLIISMFFWFLLICSMVLGISLGFGFFCREWMCIMVLLCNFLSLLLGLLVIVLKLCIGWVCISSRLLCIRWFRWKVGQVVIRVLVLVWVLCRWLVLRFLQILMSRVFGFGLVVGVLVVLFCGGMEEEDVLLFIVGRFVRYNISRCFSMCVGCFCKVLVINYFFDCFCLISY